MSAALRTRLANAVLCTPSIESRRAAKRRGASWKNRSVPRAVLRRRCANSGATSGGKSTVQGVGSTNSYLRRYIACNIFNIVVVGDDDDGNGSTIDETQTTTLLELIKKAKVGPKFLKYMRAQSTEEAGSLEAAVATIASRDYRKAITTLEEQIAKAEASHANFS